VRKSRLAMLQYDVPEREEAMQDPCHNAGPARFEKEAAKIEGESPLVTPRDSLAFAASENNKKKCESSPR
jgi:hypothetical protein